MEEVWKTIKSHENYEVSNYGNVRRIGSKKNLSPFEKDGYLRLNLQKDGRSSKFYVHRLVAIEFIPNVENKREVNHINFNKKDNRVSNLEWSTGTDNIKHYHESDAAKQYYKTVKKLSQEDVNFILENATVGNKTLAKKFSVDRNTIRDIRRGNAYKNEVTFYNENFLEKIF